MAYNWRPTGSRVATTTAPHAVVSPRRAQTRSAAAASSPSGSPRVGTVVDEFIEAAEDGRAGNRSGRSYRPSALRDLRGILRQHVAREVGHLRLSDVRRQHLQALVDRLAAEGLSESRIRSVISAVRALYGFAIERGYVEVSPADRLVIPDPGETDWTWTDDVDEGLDEEREESDGRPRPDRYGGDYKPIELLPERILSLVLRIVVVIFIIFALVTIAGSA
jgi:Phage integrase, N-terminal SAM-like domain